MRLLLILILSLSFQVSAGVLKPLSGHFKTVGEVASFQWAPARYQSDFTYDILYYIPESLRNKNSVKSLIFMHGGGASTSTRQGSLNVASSYMQGTLVRLANELQMAVVVPSAAGLNWGGHTIGMIRDLTRLLRSEVSVDHNNIGLSGHSMGGMGIGRSFPFLADEFAYFLPMAAGIDEKIQHEDHLNKVFNVPYVHLQGLKDHFTIFKDRCEEQKKRTSALEIKYGRKSLLEVIYYEGAHNHDYNLMKSTIVRLQKSPRNLYQDTLYGSLQHNDNFYTENNIRFHQGSFPRYFWIKFIESSGSRERLDFTASIKNNIVRVNFKQSPKSIKRVRIYLSKKLINPDKEMKIVVNDKLVETRMLQHYPRVDKVDRGYLFDDYIDLVFKN